MFPGLNLKKSRAQYNMYGREQGSTDLAGNQFFRSVFFLYGEETNMIGSTNGRINRIPNSSYNQGNTHGCQVVRDSLAGIKSIQKRGLYSMKIKIFTFDFFFQIL